MGLIAAGRYLREIRRLRGLSRVALAADLGISDDQINRMEQGRNAMLGPTLLRLITRIDGSYAEVVNLLDLPDEPAVEEAAAIRARGWVTREATLGNDLTPAETTAELYELALRRSGGDRAAARRLLLQALDQVLE